jgi:hypothetical protein
VHVSQISEPSTVQDASVASFPLEHVHVFEPDPQDGQSKAWGLQFSEVVHVPHSVQTSPPLTNVAAIAQEAWWQPTKSQEPPDGAGAAPPVHCVVQDAAEGWQ